MDFFERLRRSVGNVPWGTVANAMADGLGARSEAAEEIVRQLTEWGAHLTGNALAKWTVAVAMPVGCDSPDVSSGRPRPCESHAVVRCDVCGRPCCLAHARIDFMGDAICEVCIGEAKARKRAAPNETYSRPHGERREKRGERRRESPPAEERVASEMTVSLALKTLKVRKNADWHEIRVAYRKLVLKHNADRPQTDEQRSRNTERLKTLNAAYAVLKARHEKREAA